MSRKKTETKPERVALVNQYGAIARPLIEDVELWLAAGWARVETKEKADG